MRVIFIFVFFSALAVAQCPSKCEFDDSHAEADCPNVLNEIRYTGGCYSGELYKPCTSGTCGHTYASGITVAQDSCQQRGFWEKPGYCVGVSEFANMEDTCPRSGQLCYCKCYTKPEPEPEPETCNFAEDTRAICRAETGVYPASHECYAGEKYKPCDQANVNAHNAKAPSGMEMTYQCFTLDKAPGDYDCTVVSVDRPFCCLGGQDKCLTACIHFFKPI